jgi:hypothetical protein
MGPSQIGGDKAETGQALEKLGKSVKKGD